MTEPERLHERTDMHITGYELLTTYHDWGRPIGDANGVISGGITEVPIVLLHTNVGLTGVGVGSHESVPELFEVLDGRDPRAVTALYDSMLGRLFKVGHQGAAFAGVGTLDLALWDLKAKASDMPLWLLLGANDHFVEGYASPLCFGLEDSELSSLLKRWQSSYGFTSAKLKGGVDQEADIHRLSMAREILSQGPRKPKLMIDVNETMTGPAAIAYARAVTREVPLEWFEEPVRRWNIDGLRSVKDRGYCAVASGENLTGLEQVRLLAQNGAVDVIQCGSIWGVTHFIRSANVALAFDLPISPVGYNCNPLAAAAAAVPNVRGIEIQDDHFPIGISVDQEFVDGGVRLGSAPGNGISIDRGQIEKLPDHGALWTSDQGPHVRSPAAAFRLGS